MRLAHVIVALSLAATACHGQRKAEGGLPPEWPVKQLTLPADAQVFEGHVDTKEGGTAVTVFYVAGAGWEAQAAHVESKLGPLHYRAMPQGEDAAGGAAATGPHQAWCAPDGGMVVFLSQDDAPPDKSGPASYFTLLAKKLDKPIAVDPAWPEIGAR